MDAAEFLLIECWHKMEAASQHLAEELIRDEWRPVMQDILSERRVVDGRLREPKDPRETGATRRWI